MSIEHSPARDGRKIVRLPKVLELTGMSRTTIWRRVRAGKFPAPLSLGEDESGAIGWFLDEVIAWQQERPRVNYAQTRWRG